MHINKNQYSEALQEKTKEMLIEQPFMPEDKYYFKHPEFGYATLEGAVLRAGKFQLNSLKEERVFDYDSIETLICSGWVCD